MCFMHFSFVNKKVKGDIMATAAPTTAAAPAAAVPRAKKATSEKHDVLLKSIVIGDSSVGKSSLLYRYIDDGWDPHYISTYGFDYKSVVFNRDKKVYKLQIWDTAGQERFRSSVHLYYRGCHAVLVVFDVTSHESFENIATWLKDVKDYATANVPLVLVGNRYDISVEEHEVTDEEHRRWPRNSAALSKVSCNSTQAWTSVRVLLDRWSRKTTRRGVDPKKTPRPFGAGQKDELSKPDGAVLNMPTEVFCVPGARCFFGGIFVCPNFLNGTTGKFPSILEKGVL